MLFHLWIDDFGNCFLTITQDTLRLIFWQVCQKMFFCIPDKRIEQIRCGHIINVIMNDQVPHNFVFRCINDFSGIEIRIVFEGLSSFLQFCTNQRIVSWMPVHIAGIQGKRMISLFHFSKRLHNCLRNGDYFVRQSLYTGFDCRLDYWYDILWA